MVAHACTAGDGAVETTSFDFPCGRASESHLKHNHKEPYPPLVWLTLEDGIESTDIVPKVVCLAGLRGNSGL